MTFAGNCNYSTPADGAAAMVTLLAQLVAAGWAITDQSDGGTLGNAFNGANGSWFAVEVPGVGTQSWCIQADKLGDKTLWRVKYAPNTFTGGSPAAQEVPSATGEVLLIGGGTDAAPAFNQLLTTDGTYRWLVACDDAAPYGWHAMAFPSGGADPTSKTLLLFDPLLPNSYPAADPDPYVVRAAYQVYTYLPPPGNITQYSNPYGVFGGANSYQSAKLIGGVWQGAGHGYPVIANGPALGAGGQTGVEPYTGFEQRALCFYGRTAQGLIGYSSLMTIGMCTSSPSRVTGDVLQIGTDYFVRLDYIYLPWDSTPVVI